MLSCVPLFKLMDRSSSGCSVHGIFQARILEQVGNGNLRSPGDLSDPGIKPMFPESPPLAGGFFTTTPPGKPTHADRQMLNMLAFSTY